MKMRGKVSFITQLILLSTWCVLSACSAVHEAGPLSNPVDGGDDNNPQKMRATFSDIETKIFNPRCSGTSTKSCHVVGGEAELMLLDHDSLMNNRLVKPGDPDNSRLIKSVEGRIRRMMPPPQDGPPLSSEEIAVIRRWIANNCIDEQVTGEPDEPGGDEPAPTPAPAPPPSSPPAPKVTFVELETKIFNPKCSTKECHSLGGRAELVLLDKASLLMPGLGSVIPSKPDESRLVMAVEGRIPRRMMPPTQVAPALSKEEINAIRSWIAAGSVD